MSDFNRRNFLRGLGAAAMFLTSPEKLLMGSLVDGLFNKSMAQQNGVSEKILINIFLNGGPSRWFFDLPLRPNGDDPFLANGSVANIFDNNNAVFANTKAKINNKYYLPYLWDSDIPTSDGKTTPMARLAGHAAFIRGYSTSSGSHIDSRDQHNAPVSGQPSLSGIFADHSLNPLAISNSEDFSHKSASGKGLTKINSNQASINNLLSNFDLFNSSTLTKFNSTDAMNAAMKELQNRVSSHFGKTHPYALNLKNEKEKTIALASRVSAINKAEFTTLLFKYQSLETRSYSEITLDGIDNTTLTVTPNTPAEGTRVSKFSNSLGAGGYIYPGPQANPGLLTSMLDTNTRAHNMAESFALAEFLVKNNLSSSIMLGLGGLNINLNAFNYLNGAGNRITSSGFEFDSHYSGVNVSLLVYSKFYRAFAACLYELINQLKSFEKFDKTIIQLNGDFNRSAMSSGFGSDHGSSGCATSIYSGMFQNAGPIVVGNIATTHPFPKFAGTWGHQAPMRLGSSNRDLTVGNIVSTVSALAGYESPKKNDMGLLEVDSNGTLKLNADEPKNLG